MGHECCSLCDMYPNDNLLLQLKTFEGLITLCVVSLAFFLFLFFLVFLVFFFSRFHSRFGYQHVGIQNASENTRKTQEKRKKITQRENIFLYYTMRWVNMRAGCVFSHVLERLRLPKGKPNA